MLDPFETSSLTSSQPKDDTRDPRNRRSPSLTLKAPKVLVVITCHNYAGLVADAIQSVANQTYSDFECVVVDDALEISVFISSLSVRISGRARLELELLAPREDGRRVALVQ
jgi:hypothetical protein